MPTGDVEVVRTMWPQRSFRTRIPRHGLVLDLGCGDFTRSARSVARFRPDVRFVGVEKFADGTIYERGVDHARFRHPVVACDVDRESLPFADGMFDGVYCSHVIEHVEDMGRLVAEASRVVRPGGVVYLETPGPRSLLHVRPPWVARDFGGTVHFHDDPTHLRRPIDVSELRALCTDHDLTPLRAGIFRELGLAGMPVYAAMAAAGILGAPRRRASALFGAGMWNLTGFAIYCVARKPTASELAGAPAPQRRVA